MKHKFSSLEGKILMASPRLEDRFFEKALIYIFMHDKNGAFGVILNHEIGSVSNHELLKLFDKNTNKVKIERLPIVFGGPVNTERIIALSIDKQREKQFSSMQSIVLHTDIQNFVKKFIIKNDKSKFLLARGISAWSSNQLEDEISGNSWLVSSGNDLRNLINDQIDGYWKNHMLGLGGRYSIWANAPENPEYN